MKQDRYPHQSLIKQDIEEIVGRVVGEIVGAALQLIANQFDAINIIMASKVDITRLENKLNPTLDAVDDHSVRIKRLERGIAT